jgi:ribosomal protein L37E
MICEECKIERMDKDFMAGQMSCYKCVYKRKISVKVIKMKTVCRECGGDVVHPRRVFCSQECAVIDKAKNNNTHWTNKIKFHYVGFKGDDRMRIAA